MSGRIRSLKPEWLEDEKLGACSDAARVLSVGLILLADDWGNLRASELRIASQAWGYSGDGPDTFAKAARALQELRDLPFVVPYRVRGQAYLHIRKWFDHQKVDKPGRPLVPMPDFVVAEMPGRWRACWEAVRKKYGCVAEAAESGADPGTGPPPSCAIRERGTTDRDRDRDRDQDQDHDARGAPPESDPEPPDGLACHAAYRAGWPKPSVEPSAKGARPGQGWDPLWEELALWCQRQAEREQAAAAEVLDRLLAAAWADDWLASKGWPPSAILSKAGELYAATADDEPGPEPDAIDRAIEDLNEAICSGDFDAQDRIRAELDRLRRAG